ncbi:G-type lectin S-receptor-like serine/threonine-protein kinase At4g27290, partial [Bidens hawaiensis]|uniref:G-type lectin S-receptor-like serine/threonine-protein kinase At4g27290 n=1 Tax=Bidens hawaiensis TaxID=980011 RepID=UPI00404B31FA
IDMNQPMVKLLPHITSIVLLFRICNSLDTISVQKNIIDGEAIVSGNAKFELGFFSPGSSKHRYLGIWFKNTSPRGVIWVANRETPLTNTLGVVNLDNQGILSIFNGAGKTIWSSTSFVSFTKVNPVAQLLDTGNLVIKVANSVIWQSFDYPGDTLISDMKLGKNFVTGRELYLTSWRSADDPSTGEYTLSCSMEEGRYPQFYIKKGSIIETRIGPYDGVEFAGLPKYTSNLNTKVLLDMVVRQQVKYFWYTSNLTKISFKSTVNPSGKLEVSRLNNQNHDWMQDHTTPLDYCDNYGLCGPYESCSTTTFPACKCLKGFELKIAQLNSGNRTSGCTRSIALDCGPEEGFLKFSSMKLPDTQNAVYYFSLSIQECEVACKDNCSCTAYANPNTTAGGIGCLLWFGDLIDVRVYSQNGQDLHVRLAAIELSEINMVSHYKRKRMLIMAISTSSALVLLFTVAYACIRKNRKSRKKIRGKRYALHKKNTDVQIEDLEELPFFSLNKIAKATDNFSINNKIGEGGFGPVYKGVLENGQEVAIKRLSETSKQGLDEFKNEVICIAKLQHRNLVKLLGYCVHGTEMILIYEYMANKSLDSLLFDETRSQTLDWPKRLNIIHGIARGILYLHQDSRLQIIHRDLKAANILLDDSMNPKISDFGLARKFLGSGTAAMTKKVVGTYGYISPEYAVHGRFSIKSDVFSFGVLMLEIVSGKKNRGFSHKDHNDNLLGHAWRLYKEGRASEVMDAAIKGSCNVSEVLRSIHVGLLCVQHNANDRPTMLSVVLMLVSESVLPEPKQPAFFTGENDREVQSVSSFDEEMITQLYAR